MAKKAILFGVNNYKHNDISDLRGCVNDVENIYDLLIEEFGFRARDIRRKTDRDVILRNVEDDWQWLVKSAEPGDQLVFHFAGHGSQVPNEIGDDDEDDGLDEILCLYDMNFDDPGSYLIDDEIYRWTQDLPDGVNMTFLLDCCHSGTGTRAMNMSKRSLDRSMRALPQIITSVSEERSKLEEIRQASKKRGSRSVATAEESQDPSVVLARYLYPPQEIFDRVRKRASRSKRKREKTNSEPTNHVRFSGCKDNQTSADAYIDGEFQGAFSAHFRKAIEEHGSDVSHRDLIDHIREALADDRFDQTPQLNPESLETAVFAGLSDSQQDSDIESLSGDRENYSQLVRRIDRLTRALEGFVASAISAPNYDTNRGNHEDVDNRSIVYIHGICWHKEGYSDQWFDAIKYHLDRSLTAQLTNNREEVRWSHLVSSGDRNPSCADSRSAKEQKLVDELQEIIRDRVSQAMESQMPPTNSRGTKTIIGTRDMKRALWGIPGLDCVDDFVKYLYSNRIRKKVMAEFTEKVVPLLEQGHLIEVVSHSWGTVVALEALHRLSTGNYDGRVNNLFTVGSALSIGPVQRRLKYGAENGGKPGLVDNWINIDARGDVVGGTLRGFSSDVDAEYLNLEPVGCDEGFFGVSASCAHGSYFDERNLVVNRDIFARNIGG